MQEKNMFKARAEILKQSSLLMSDYGILRRVDRWKMRGDVQFLNRNGGAVGIPFHLNFSSRSMNGGLPAEGSMVEVSYTLGQDYTPQGFISGVLPSQFEAAYELNTVQEMRFEGNPVTRPQIPAISPGSWYTTAEDLTSWHVVERVGAFLALPDGQKFYVTLHDHTMVHESPLLRQQSAGAWSNMGIISRPGDTNHRWMTVGGEFRNFVTAQAGKTCENLFNNFEDRGARLLLEHGLALWETSDTVCPVTHLDEVGRDKYGFDYESIPLLINLQGTVVGAHPDMVGYGQPLYCQVFDSIDDQQPSNPRMIGITPTLEQDRMTFQFALTQLFHLPREKTGKSFYGIDKQGKLFFVAGKSLRDSESSYQTSGLSEDPLGAHRSVDGYLEGSAKLHVGKNWNEEVSVDFSTEGKVRQRIGKDNGSKGAIPLMISIDTTTEGKVVLKLSDDSGGAGEQLLSLDMETTRGVKLVIKGPATDTNALNIETTGHVKLEVVGNISVHATETITITGDTAVRINP